MEMSGHLHTQAAFPLIPIELEAGWAPEPISMSWDTEKKFHQCLRQELNHGLLTCSLVTILIELHWLQCLL